MKLHKIIKIICALIFLPALCIHSLPRGETTVSHALTTPGNIVITPEVKVSQKRVCLLDLCRPEALSEEWRELLKSEDLGAAPSVGEQKYILAEHLRTYLNRFFIKQGCDPSQIVMNLPAKVLIQRTSVRLPDEEIEAIYREFVLSRSPWDVRDVEIHNVYFSGVPELPEGKISHEVLADPKERFIGKVSVTIQFFVDGEKDRSLRATGKVDVYQNVIHALNPLKRNDIIEEKSIEVQRINVAGDPDRYVRDVEQVIGKQLLRDIGMHQPIAFKDLNQPTVVKRGGIVTIIYENGGLKLTAKGEVRGNACVGDTIRVTNLMTKRSTLCMVVDEETVRLVH